MRSTYNRRKKAHHFREIHIYYILMEFFLFVTKEGFIYEVHLNTSNSEENLFRLMYLIDVCRNCYIAIMSCQTLLH